MTYKVFLIHTSGEIEVSTQAKAPKLDQLQKAVGGWIETVPYFTKLELHGETYSRGRAFCNEEGKIRGLPHNSRATALWMMACPKGDPSRMNLVGDVIFYAKVKEPSQ